MGICPGSSSYVVQHKRLVSIGSGAPLFTELPRREILGNWVSVVQNSRKLNLCHYTFLETLYIEFSETRMQPVRCLWR